MGLNYTTTRTVFVRKIKAIYKLSSVFLLVESVVEMSNTVGFLSVMNKDGVCV